MKSQSVKFVSLISLCLLAIAMFVVGVWSVTAPSLNINGNVDMAVGTNALYIKDLRIKDADDPSDTGTTFENFDPGFVHNNIPVNLGRIDRTSSFVLLFDVVNTTTTYYMASTNSTVSGATLSAEGILMNSGISPTEAVTTSEISGTISLTVTLTSSSPVTLNNVVINFEETSGITVYSTDSTRGTGYATGVAMDGQTVTLNAEFTEDLEADFLGWRVGSATGEVISTLPEYTFTFNEGDPTTYYAEFTEPNTFLTYSTLSTGTVSVSRSGNTMTELTIPSMVYRTNISASRVTEIRNYGFENCTSLQSLSIPETVTNIGYQAFRYCNSLTDITIPEGVTRIQMQTFYACVSLQNITIPNTVTSIEERAFTSCEALQNITIPSGVISIGDYAFRYCNSLATATVESFTIYEQLTSQDETVCGGMLATKAHIYVPQNIVNSYTNDYLNDTSIYVRTTSGNYYVYAKALDFTFTISGSNGTLTGYTGSDTSITIPETFSLFGDVAVAGTDYTVTAIGDSGMFSGPFSQVSSTLQNVILPETLEYIGAHAFYACIGLVSITIPDNVTNIGERAFGFCSNLTNVTLPNNSISIGIYAFTNCTSLQSITIPAGLESIGENAFLDCTSLNTVTLENINIYQSIDGDTSAGSILSHASTIYVLIDIVGNYTSTYLEDTNNYARYTSGNYYIFTRALGFKFTTSGSTATLTGYTGSATSVTIPKTFSLINGVAVAGKNYTVTAIGDNAFKGNLNLRTIEIPNSVTSIGNSAFENCTRLTTIMSMNGVRSIGNSAFADCSSLTNLTIPASANADISIGQSAFASCISLTSVIIPTGIASMGIRAFWGCYALAEVYNYSSTTITAGAITGSTNSHFGNLGQYARVVHNSTDMSGGRPASRIGVYNNVQYYVYSNTRIALAPSIARISLTSVALHNSTTEITPYAFSGCTNLESVTIPYGVDTIGYYAFSDCTSLNSITIPASVDEMDIWVFSNCSNLTTITIESIHVYTTLDADDTSGIIENATTIYVPQNIVNSYTNNYLNNTSYYSRSTSGSYYVFTKS